MELKMNSETQNGCNAMTNHIHSIILFLLYIFKCAIVSFWSRQERVSLTSARITLTNGIVSVQYSYFLLIFLFTGIHGSLYAPSYHWTSMFASVTWRTLPICGHSSYCGRSTATTLPTSISGSVLWEEHCDGLSWAPPEASFAFFADWTLLFRPV